MYADYQYYTCNFLHGHNPVVSNEKDFAFYEMIAEKEINNRTFGRIINNPNLLNDDVKNCACAVTEFLFKCSNLDEINFKNGGGQLVSYSNDGDSGSYDMSQSVYASEQSRQNKINNLVSFYLSGTGLLYRGVD